LRALGSRPLAAPGESALLSRINALRWSDPLPTVTDFSIDIAVLEEFRPRIEAVPERER
jgi:hypothetical protein